MLGMSHVGVRAASPPSAPPGCSGSLRARFNVYLTRLSLSPTPHPLFILVDTDILFLLATH